MWKTRDSKTEEKAKKEGRLPWFHYISNQYGTHSYLHIPIKTQHNNSSAMKLVLLSTMALTANAFSPPVSPPLFSSTSNHPSRTHTTLAEDFGLFKGTSLGFDDIWGDNEVRGNWH